MRGTAGLGRRGLLTLGAAAVLAACTSTPKSADDDKVHTDPEPLERRFPALGPLTEAHWLEIVLTTDSRGSVPGPTDYRTVGTARLGAGVAAIIVGTPPRAFRAETPAGIPERLVEFVPEAATWVRSAGFDDEVTGGTYNGAFYLDAATDRVYFDTSTL